MAASSPQHTIVLHLPIIPWPYCVLCRCPNFTSSINSKLHRAMCHAAADQSAPYVTNCFPATPAPWAHRQLAPVSTPYTSHPLRSVSPCFRAAYYITTSTRRSHTQVPLVRPTHQSQARSSYIPRSRPPCGRASYTRSTWLPYLFHQASKPWRAPATPCQAPPAPHPRSHFQIQSPCRFASPPNPSPLPPTPPPTTHCPPPSWPPCGRGPCRPPP